jgi:predicted nucleic acid-binding protein
MAEKSVPDRNPAQPGTSGIYIDSSALAKLYVPEAESGRLDKFLRGRRDLIISDLAITEVISATGRRKRESHLTARQASDIRAALLADAQAGSFRRVDISPAIHREAERMLLAAESIVLRTLDALHIALALSVPAGRVITFDVRMADAAALYGLDIVKLTG